MRNYKSLSVSLAIVQVTAACGIKKPTNARVVQTEKSEEVKNSEKPQSNSSNIPSFELGTVAAPAALLSFSQGNNVQPISNQVYGINYIWNRTIGFDGLAMNHSQLPFGMIRWGGNGTTRYNWQNDSYNTAADWPDAYTGTKCDLTYPGESFFNGGANRSSNGLTAVADMYQTFPSSTPLVTVPIIGLVSKDLTSVLPPNATKPNPFATSMAVGPSFFQPWISQLQNTGRNQVYALDNEPALWNSTHTDIYGCGGASSADVWEKGKAIATMIKTTAPNAKVTGLNTWGWCDLHYSGKDGCSPGTDYAAQGNKPQVSWYLEQICKPSNLLNGKRLVDTIDVHWYPMDLNNPTRVDSDRYKALRMTRNLFDPNYLEENWINTANGGKGVRLIPWLKEQIAQYCPGTKIGISEWRYGELDDQARTAKAEGTYRPEWAVAMANAEALAIMGREGVEFSTIWDRLPSGSHAENAFKLFLNFDGNGSNLFNANSINVTGHTVTATQSGVNSELYPGSAISTLDVSPYIVQKTVGGKLKTYAIIFNKSAHTVGLNFSPVGASLSAAFKAFSFNTSNSLKQTSTGTLSSGKLTASVEPWSVTMFEVDVSGGGANPQPSPSPTPAPTPTPQPTPVPPSGTIKTVDLYANRIFNSSLSCVQNSTQNSCDISSNALNLTTSPVSFLNKSQPFSQIVLDGKPLTCGQISSFSSDRGMQVDVIDSRGWIVLRRDRTGKITYRSDSCATDAVLRIEVTKDSTLNPTRVQIKIK